MASILDQGASVDRQSTVLRQTRTRRSRRSRQLRHRITANGHHRRSESQGRTLRCSDASLDNESGRPRGPGYLPAAIRRSRLGREWRDGEVIRFNVNNDGKILHEFSIGNATVQVALFWFYSICGMTSNTTTHCHTKHGQDFIFCSAFLRAISYFVKSHVNWHANLPKSIWNSTH